MARLACTLLLLLASGNALAVDLGNPALPPPLTVEPGDSGFSPDAAEPPVEAPFAPPAATFEQQIAELVNNERASCITTGCPLPPLKFLPLLSRVSEGHGVSMSVNDFFGHCDMPTGSSPWARMLAAGYTYFHAGENLVAGSSSAAGAMSVWMASSGHRANILSPNFTELGVGYVYQSTDQAGIARDSDGDCLYCEPGDNCAGGPYFHYWVQGFGSRSGVFPLVIEGEDHTTSTGNVDLYVYGPAGAGDMRFSNDGVTWSSWMPYDATTTWSLAAGDGLRTVFSEVRKLAVVYRGCDRIWRIGAGGNELYVDRFECDGLAGWSSVVP